MDRQKFLKQLDKAWTAFKESYAGLSDSELTESGITGDWSVKDIIAHVTWWEEESLKHLPLLIERGRPPRYSVKYGGIDKVRRHRRLQYPDDGTEPKPFALRRTAATG